MRSTICTPGPGDEATWPAPSGHPNDPRTLEPTDEQLSWELSLLRKAFPLDDCSSCRFYTADDERGDRCEVLHGDADQDECVALPELVADAERALEEEAEAEKENYR